MVLSPPVVACLAATWFIWGSGYLAIKVTLTGLLCGVALLLFGRSSAEAGQGDGQRPSTGRDGSLAAPFSSQTTYSSMIGRLSTSR
jgi:hypothetical protein